MNFSNKRFYSIFRQVGHQAEQGRILAEEPEAASGNFFVRAFFVLSLNIGEISVAGI